MELFGKIAAAKLRPIAAWMSAIPDTIRRLIISFSRYDIIAIGALKVDRLPENMATEIPALCLHQKRMHSNDIASCSP